MQNIRLLSLAIFSKRYTFAKGNLSVAQLAEHPDCKRQEGRRLGPYRGENTAFL